eukprot:CAMPEP_0172179458 /NCGR_PEP_ID=MMETSP1050-20130122/16631_1 /TAXON_ID=233186 /ORGANISM="Cryptomonas curvata, Strain CCAP979/52" /LENGTH=39 /DNA_ID= /DNA_START= /DNA_END= /DNA_ORIENTATION=
MRQRLAKRGGSVARAGPPSAAAAAVPLPPPRLDKEPTQT